MSTFNPALVKEKLPGAIEEMLEAHKKAVAGAEVVCESCKSTNIPQMISDGNSLVTIISGSWFGIGGQQAACVAMEHPPTFAAMTYIAFDQRGYRRSTFADMVTKSFKGTGGEVEIVRSVNRIFDQWI